MNFYSQVIVQGIVPMVVFCRSLSALLRFDIGHEVNILYATSVVLIVPFHFP